MIIEEGGTRAYLYEEMLILLCGNLTQSTKNNIDEHLQWFIEQGVRGWEAKMRCQISWNHTHLSRTKTLKRITEVQKAVKKRLPKMTKRLRADWLESGEDKEVNISFYFDREKL